MSRTSVHSRLKRGRRGFTLVEMLVATSVSAIIFAGILAAYLFVGRNLTRMVNVQHQEVESRRTLWQVTADVSAATQLTTATTSQIVLTKPVSGNTATVTYSYSSANGTLSRTVSYASGTPPASGADIAGTQTMLTGVTAFTITYYNEGGTAVSSSPQSVKSVEFSFTSASGSSGSGTRASYATVSPRVLLRNKQALQ
jgi:prepilin-type N-terminal cleavage/methylation domain-containing protein